MRRLQSVFAIFSLTLTCSFLTATKSNFSTCSGNFTLSADTSTFYFPADKLDTFSNTWYSKMLRALHEPVLYNYSGDKEIYRFTWLRTFHHPVSLRLENNNNKITLTVKVSNGAGGYDPGQIIIDTTIDITLDDWNTFVGKADKVNFWNLQTEVKEMGLDGSEWILEGVTKNKYHFTTRWSPPYSKNEGYRDCCDYLISLSKLKIPKRDKY